MRICSLSLLFFFCGLSWYGSASPSNIIALDAVERELEFVDFHLGTFTLDGTFRFVFTQDSGSLTLGLEGRGVTLNGQYFSWLKAHLTRRGELIFIDSLTVPQYALKGSIDFKEQEFSLDAEGRWQEDSQFLEGDVYVKAKIWGEFSNFATSGYLTVSDGVYESQEFSKLRLDFLGKPPLLNVTDSEILLAGGSVYEIENGVLDLRDFSNPMISGDNFISQKAYLGDWQIYSDSQKSAGLRKQVDPKLDVFLNTSDPERDERKDLQSGTELRYNWKDDQFLKLRMESDRTILGFEKRRDF